MISDDYRGSVHLKFIFGQSGEDGARFGEEGKLLAEEEILGDQWGASR
jgi:hypothetical protein